MKTARGPRYAIGVDLGGSKVALGILDNEGCLHERRYLDTQVHEGALAIQERVLAGICALEREGHVPIIGVGVGAAGQIHPETGEVMFAPNLQWRHIPFQANLKNALGLPVKVMNDVRAITRGEWLYGAGKGCEDLLCIFVGTGIGGGVVSGGRLLTGSNNTFGEVGHMTVDFQGPLCSCGKSGCLEVYASGWGIAARAQEAIHVDPDDTNARELLDGVEGQIVRLTSQMVAEASRKGNAIARGVIGQAEKALVAGIASLINVYNPSRLILGGGVIEGIPELMTAIQIGVPGSALRSATEHLTILKAKLGQEAGIIGAASALF